MPHQIKRITTCILAAAIILSLICAAPPQAWAAEKPYMNLWGNYDVPYDKVGNYYIWVKWDYDTGATALVCAPSKNGRQKVLKKIKSEKFSIDSNIVTDGNTVYYGTRNYETGAYTIYKTNITGQKHQKITSVKYGAHGGYVGGCYNGKLYFGKDRVAGDMSISPKALYSYDIPKKQKKQIEETLNIRSSYGPYMLCYDENGGSDRIYNAKTKKLQNLPALKAVENAVVYRNNIYYSVRDGKTDLTLIKKCSLSGKNVKTIKTLKDAYILHMGKTAVYYTAGDSEKTKKLAYQ